MKPKTYNFKIIMTAEEIHLLIKECDSMVDCDTDAIDQFPESANYFKMAVRFWKRLRKDLKTLKKGKSK